MTVALRAALVAALLLVSTGGAAAHADAASSATDRVVLLLDVSTSMGEVDADGRVKIEGAKSGVTSLLETLPGSTQIGLMTYPGDGDCGEPQRVREVQSLGEGNLGAVVNALPRPKGNTPTALALRKAAEEASSGEGQGVVVLVSDGMANCGAPPCPVARDIARQGVALTVNTVGFAIDEVGRQELQCIANATGGQYVDVSDGDQLGTELAQQLTASLEIRSSFPSGPVPISAVGAPVSIQVTNRSGVSASNVRATLAPVSAASLLGILKPVVYLGNLAKGETRQVDWTIPVTPQLLDQSLVLKVSATGSNTVMASQEGVVRFGAAGASLIGTESQFAGAARVAVLGDSYSAGDGSHRELSQYAQKDCRRSVSAYAEALFPGKVSNFACTGAVMSHVTASAQNPSAPPQIEQLRKGLQSGQRFDLVFLTIGGNDVGFGDIAANCIAHTVLGPLSRGASKLPFLNPCSADPNSVLYDIQQDLVDAQAPLLRDTYEQLAMTFSSMSLDVPPIIVSPYPLMSPTDPALRRSCGLINLAVSMQQFEHVLNFQRKLNGLIEAAVNQTRTQSGVPVYYAGPVASSLQPDHTLCGSKPWITLPRADNVALVGSPRRWDTPFHPTSEGYQAWALALVRWSSQPGLKLDVGRKPKDRKVLPWIFTLAPRGSIDADDPTDLVASGEAELTVTGLMPYSPVVAVVRSNPYPLGHGRADADGNARMLVRLDARLISAGRHQLLLGVKESSGTERVRVTSLYVTRPVPYVSWVALIGGVALTIGGFLWLRKTSGGTVHRRR